MEFSRFPTLGATTIPEKFTMALEQEKQRRAAVQREHEAANEIYRRQQTADASKKAEEAKRQAELAQRLEVAKEPRLLLGRLIHSAWARPSQKQLRKYHRANGQSYTDTV